MKVYYTFDKVKGRRVQQALTVIYENNSYIPKRNFKTIWNNWNEAFFERYQTDFEAECANDIGRMFSNYTYFFSKFNSIEELIRQCIDDDKYLCENPESAKEFKERCLESVGKAYSTLLFSKRKKNKTQPQLF